MFNTYWIQVAPYYPIFHHIIGYNPYISLYTSTCPLYYYPYYPLYPTYPQNGYNMSAISAYYAPEPTIASTLAPSNASPAMSMAEFVNAVTGGPNPDVALIPESFSTLSPTSTSTPMTLSQFEQTISNCASEPEQPACISPQYAQLIGFRVATKGSKCPFQFCRHKVNHFHCADCVFGFRDTHALKIHSANHSLCDKLMGGDFEMHERIDTIIWPDLSDSEQNNTKYCYHCNKCDFFSHNIIDILPHRRQHMLSANQFVGQSFRKVLYYEVCCKDLMGLSFCKYNLQVTHYHCNKCHEALQDSDLDTHNVLCYHQ